MQLIHCLFWWVLRHNPDRHNPDRTQPGQDITRTWTNSVFNPDTRKAGPVGEQTISYSQFQFQIMSSLGCVRYRLCLFQVVSILSCVNSILCQVYVVSNLGCVQSRFCQFQVVSIRLLHWHLNLHFSFKIFFQPSQHFCFDEKLKVLGQSEHILFQL